jgi:hypothetical protein
MNKRQIALKLILDELGFGLKVESFEQRLILQKACYLVQASDVNLGYHFSWYLHGPYCSPLAKEAFAARDELDSEDDESEGWELDEPTIRGLKKVQALLADCEVADTPKKLELLASVHFLVTKKGISPVDIPILTSTLERAGKKFAESEVASATEGLAKHGFIS